VPPKGRGATPSVQQRLESSRAGAFDRRRRQMFLAKADLDLDDGILSELRSRSDDALGIGRDLLARMSAAFAFHADVQIERAHVQGTFHRLYEVRTQGTRRYLRVAAMPGLYDAQLMELECRMMEVLRLAGLPVPACAFGDVELRGVPRGAQLIDAADGVCVAEFDDDEERTAAALGHVGGFLSRLHRIGGDAWGPVSLAALCEGANGRRLAGVHERWDEYVLLRLEQHVAVCALRGAISDDEAVRIARAVAAHRDRLDLVAPAALLHGDPGSHNFVVDGASLSAALDWEDALIGDPLFDVASLCTFHPERRHAAIFAGYGIDPRAGDDTWVRFWLYFLRIALAKTVHRFRFAYSDRPGRTPASSRIQLALSRLAQTS